ncbi:hypothetical protein GCM10027514_25820 [Azotobacter armeniacus]
MAETPAPAGQVRVQGRLVEGGIVCPLLRTAEGELLPLTGIGINEYPLSTRLTVNGVFLRVSPCMQGKRTLQVLQVLKIEEP